MKYLTTTLAALALMVAPVAAADVSAESSSAGVNIGTLTCRAEPAIGYLIGSHRDMQCAFSRAGDKIEYYNGSISRLGVDLGVTNNQTLVWAVFAPGNLGHGALSGNYLGASLEATVGVGIGVNALVGGMKNSVTLQPVSIAAQTGLNVALTGTSLSLSAKK